MGYFRVRKRGKKRTTNMMDILVPAATAVAGIALTLGYHRLKGGDKTECNVHHWEKKGWYHVPYGFKEYEGRVCPYRITRDSKESYPLAIERRAKYRCEDCGKTEDRWDKWAELHHDEWLDRQQETNPDKTYIEVTEP